MSIFYCISLGSGGGGGGFVCVTTWLPAYNYSFKYRHVLFKKMRMSDKQAYSRRDVKTLETSCEFCK